MNTGQRLFNKIIINGSEVSIEELDANNGIYRLDNGVNKANVKFVLKDKNVIPSSIFNNNLQIKKVLISDTVTTIEENAFKGNKNLSYIFIPESVENIGDNAFSSTYITAYMIQQVQGINENSFIKEIVSLVFNKSSISIEEGEEVSLQQVISNIDGLDIEYTSSDETIARISNGELIISGTGTVIITASFKGNDYYNSSTAEYTLTINKHIKQDVNLSFETNEVSFNLNDNIVLQEVNSSVEGLDIEYTSSNENVIRIENNELFVNGIGETIITASFKGNRDYNSAEATYTLIIKQQEEQHQDDNEELYYFGVATEEQIQNQEYINSLQLNSSEKPVDRIQLVTGYNLLIIPESWGIPTIADDESFTFLFTPYLADDLEKIENPENKLILVFEAGGDKLAYIRWNN